MWDAPLKYPGALAQIFFAPKPAHLWKLFVRDADYKRCAQLEDFSNLSAINRHHGVGTHSLSAAPSDASEQLMLPGAGIILTRDGKTVFSGPVTYKKRARDNTGKRTIEVSGTDDNIWLARRIIKPEPSNPDPPYGSSATDTQTGVASTVMRHYVGANLGSGATPERQLSVLTLDGDPTLGATVTYPGRYQQLLAALSLLGRAANLGFRILQDETENALRFSITPTVDRTGQVVFSEGLGNISDWSHEHTAADANYLYELGQGSGTARTVREYANGASIVEWGRAEQAYDQRSTADSGLDTAGKAQLATTSDKTTITFTVVPTGGHEWPEDWGLGDTCTAIVDDQRLDDIVREVRIDLTPDGEQITPTIATAGGAHATLSWPQALAVERKRIAQLEVGA